MHTITLNDTELHGVRAALRCYQHYILYGAGHMEIDSIATNGGLVDPIMAEDIDPLFERLSSAEEIGTCTDCSTQCVADGSGSVLCPQCDCDPELHIPESAWKAAGEGSDNEAKLIASVNLNGKATLYLEAFRVIEHAEDTLAYEMNGPIEPDPAMGEGFVEQFWDATGTAFPGDGPEHSVAIKGRRYVVFGCPGRH